MSYRHCRKPILVESQVVVGFGPLGSRRAPAVQILLGLSALLVLLILATLPARGQTAVADPATETPAGLFFKAEGRDAAFEAPLLMSDVKMAVNGLTARVTLRQHFVNPAASWMEGIYVFPLPERSAVDRLTMWIGERRVEGRILEREEARRTYEKAKAEGRRAGLLAAQRANVFVTSVANVGPGDEVVIEIEYQDRVAYRDGRFSLRFPMVVAPRFTPPGETPLAAAEPRAQPASLDAPDRDLFGPVEHPAHGPRNPLNLTVALDAGLPLASVESLYHEVAVTAPDARRRHITLAAGSVPADRDFVLEWTPRVGAAPEAAVFGEEIGGASYLAVLLVPPRDSGETAPPPRDLIFVLDTSGSMYGPSLEQAKAALVMALDRLRPEDRFNVIRFASDSERLFPALRPADPRNLGIAVRWLHDLEAEGGTMMRPALIRALAEAPAEHRLRQIVFLTDGAVSNEDAMFADIAGRLGTARLFTVGIGSAPNSYFMRKAAELGRGSFTYIGKLDEVGTRMDALLRRLERPALTDLAAAWSLPNGADPEVYPTPLPDLYDGEPVVMTARVPTALAALHGTFAVTGRRAGAAWTRRLTLANIAPAAGIAALWARAKIDRIEDGLARGEDPAEVRSAALEVALAHRLVTRYTSLVAVDDAPPVRPRDADLESREVPRNLPAGWDYAKVFGPGAAEMKLRGLPADLMQRINAAGEPIDLPQTATPALLQALIGSALLLFGALLILWWRRSERTAGHA